ncbi:hypothetical protein GCM10023080_075220 [Streptomyces pseudoechinosporeus]
MPGESPVIERGQSCDGGEGHAFPADVLGAVADQHEVAGALREADERLLETRRLGLELQEALGRRVPRLRSGHMSGKAEGIW